MNNIKYSKGEMDVASFLIRNRVPHKSQYSVRINKRTHVFDFAIIVKGSVKCFIEYDGKQHFEPVSYFGGRTEFVKRQALDKEKDDHCKSKKIQLIRVPYWTEDIDKFLLPKVSKWKSLVPVKKSKKKKLPPFNGRR